MSYGLDANTLAMLGIVLGRHTQMLEHEPANRWYLKRCPSTASEWIAEALLECPIAARMDVADAQEVAAVVDCKTPVSHAPPFTHSDLVTQGVQASLNLAASLASALIALHCEEVFDPASPMHTRLLAEAPYAAASDRAVYGQRGAGGAAAAIGPIVAATNFLASTDERIEAISGALAIVIDSLTEKCLHTGLMREQMLIQRRATESEFD